MSNVLEFNPQRPRRRRTRASDAIGIPCGAQLLLCLESWTLAIESKNLSPKTHRSYTDSVKMLIAYLDEHHMPCDAERVQAEHIRAFIVHERLRTSAASADVHFRNLRVFWGWLCSDEGGPERTTASPVLAGDRPQVAKKAKKYITQDEQRKLLAAASSNSFEDRRDKALMTILYDSGPRATGITNVRYTPRNESTHDVDLKGRRIRIRLKGGDERWIPLGAKAVQALDRYIRARSAHSRASTSPWLWLGIQGHRVDHFGAEGLRDMLARRAEDARIRKITPHGYRGTAAHQLLRAGASKDAVQRILGWKTSEMVEHYTDELADERALEIHARYSPSDLI